MPLETINFTNSPTSDEFYEIAELAVNNDKEISDMTRGIHFEQIERILYHEPSIEVQEFYFKRFMDMFQIPDNADYITFSEYLDRLIELTLLIPSENNIGLFCDKINRFCNKTKRSEIILPENVKSVVFLKRIAKLLSKQTLTEYVGQIICRFLLLLHPGNFTWKFHINIAKLLFEKFPLLWENILSKVETGGSVEELRIYSSHLTNLDRTVNFYTTSLSQYLFLYAHVLSSYNYKYNEKYRDVEIPNDFFICLMTLVSSNNYEVSWAASAVLLNHVSFGENLDSILKAVFPAVLNLISIERSNNSKYENIVLKYNLPLDTIPLSLLVKILEISPNLSISLNDLDYIQQINKIIKKKFNATNASMCPVEAYEFSMYLTILSFIGTYNDKTKINISKGDSHLIISKALDVHNKILQKWPITNITYTHLQVMVVSNRLTYASCLLLRTLSRSAYLLRTFFTSNSYMESMMNILKSDNSKFKIYDNSWQSIYSNEASLQNLILGVISNLIIEFSVVRENFDVTELLNILKNILDGADFGETTVTSLAVIRNALYGDDKFFKKKFLEIITLPKIFQLCDNNCIKIQIECFNIIRNMLTDSFYDGDYIYKAYGDYTFRQSGVSRYTEFIDFLSKHLKYSKSTKLTISICYIIVHLAASTINNKISILKSKSLLQKLLDLLLEPITGGDEICNAIWEIKTCIAWIVINLTSREDSITHPTLLRYTDDHDVDMISVGNRSTILINTGFHDALKKVVFNCPNMDFSERAGKAIFQLLVSTSTN